MRGFLAGEGFEGGREIGAGARAAQDMDDPCTRRGESPDVRDQHPRECLKIQNSKFKWNVALCAGKELTRSRGLAPSPPRRAHQAQPTQSSLAVAAPTWRKTCQITSAEKPRPARKRACRERSADVAGESPNLRCRTSLARSSSL